MKWIVTVVALSLCGVAMAGENCQKQMPSDTTMWFRAIDTTGWTNDGGHAWKPTTDSVWHKKVPIYLTPQEILQLRDLLKPRCNVWGYGSNTLRFIADTIQTIPCSTWLGDAISDSTISTGVVK